MKRKLFGAQLTAIVLSLILAASAWADPDSNHSRSGLTSPALLALIVNDDVFSTTDLTTVLATSATGGGTQHYGPYPSTSPDSGTCGNDWATDTFDRHFTVKQNADGTITVVEQFKNGSFLTMSGFSPGGCQPTPPPKGTVNGGITGSMHGYFIVPLPAGTTQTSQSPYCNAATQTNAGCTTTEFINTHFAPACYPVTCQVTTFFFHYSAGDQSLIQHEWKNASPDRGGNSGDIRSTNI
jgi:hypothetical protein